MKILIYLAVWQRPEITELCFKGLRRLIDSSDHQFEVVAPISELWARNLCDKYGFHWMYGKNKPLGNKLNIGLEYCLNFDFDYLMTSGSDDLYSNEILNRYQPYFDDHIGLIGVDKCCFIQDHEAKIVGFSWNIIGAGRFISREALRKVATKNVQVEYTTSISGTLGSFIPGDKQYMKVSSARHLEKNHVLKIISEPSANLWHPDINQGLDVNSNDRLIKSGITNKCINIGEKILILDLKSEVNIWKYETRKGIPVNYSEAIKDFPELW